MLAKLLGNLKARRALKALEKNPVYQAAFAVIRETLADETKPLCKHASQAIKEEYANRLIREVGEVVTAQDPVMVNRRKLAGYVLQEAMYLVLIIPSPTEPEVEVTGLRGITGITGELKAHLQKIAEKDKDIKELAWSLDNPTPQDLYEACLFKCWAAGFMSNVFNTTRIALGDYHPSIEKDWYRPFVAAMCAWKEHNYREVIGLPDVLSFQEDSGFDALKYFSFLNFVMDGSKYPNFEWEEHYKNKTLDASTGSGQAHTQYDSR